MISRGQKVGHAGGRVAGSSTVGGGVRRAVPPAWLVSLRVVARVVARAVVPVVVLVAPAAPAGAAEAPTGFTFSAGAFDLGRRSESFEAGGLMSFTPFDLELAGLRLPVEPAFGVSIVDDDSAHGYFALRLDLGELGETLGGRPPHRWRERWRIVAYSGIGLYDAGDRGKDLGGPVEFRSGIEVSRRIRPGEWLGLTYCHLSNAGIYRANPGEESLLVTWSLAPRRGRR